MDAHGHAEGFPVGGGDACSDSVDMHIERCAMEGVVLLQVLGLLAHGSSLLQQTGALGFEDSGVGQEGVDGRHLGDVHAVHRGANVLHLLELLEL